MGPTDQPDHSAGGAPSRHSRAAFWIFASILGLAILASHWLPGLLGLPGAQVQQAVLVVLLPVFIAFAWWLW